MRIKGFNLFERIKHPEIISRIKLLQLHDRSIHKYGGRYGIRDHSLLDSALSRPYMSAFGEDIYPDWYSKIAAFIESIITNHPLADGNKRTAYECTNWILKEQGKKLKLSYDEARPFLADLATRQDVEIKDIVKWLKQNS